MSTHFPDFFQLQPTPASLQPAATCLVRARFDHTRLAADDFRYCSVEPIRGVAKRQGEYLAGRLCAREALHRLCGQPMVPGRDEDGVPIWPEAVVGSITHGAGEALAIVGSRCQWSGLGLDVEKRLGAERAAKLAGEILTPRELERATGLAPAPFARLVTLTFSLKESLFKALYPLLLTRFYFHDAELLTWSEDGQAELRLLINLSPDWGTGARLSGQYTEFDDYLLSLVAIPSG